MGLWQRLTGGRRDGAEPTAAPAERAPGAVRQWSGLSPMPRAVVQTSLISDSGRFEARLVTRQNPQFLQPLGHAIGGGGPIGVVRGLIQPAGTPVTRQADLPPVVSRQVMAAPMPRRPQAPGLVTAGREQAPRVLPAVAPPPVANPVPPVQREVASVPAEQPPAELEAAEPSAPAEVAEESEPTSAGSPVASDRGDAARSAPQVDVQRSPDAASGAPAASARADSGVSASGGPAGTGPILEPGRPGPMGDPTPAPDSTAAQGRSSAPIPDGLESGPMSASPAPVREAPTLGAGPAVLQRSPATPAVPGGPPLGLGAPLRGRPDSALPPLQRSVGSEYLLQALGRAADPAGDSTAPPAGLSAAGSLPAGSPTTGEPVVGPPSAGPAPGPGSVQRVAPTLGSNVHRASDLASASGAPIGPVVAPGTAGDATAGGPTSPSGGYTMPTGMSVAPAVQRSTDAAGPAGSGGRRTAAEASAGPTSSDVHSSDAHSPEGRPVDAQPAEVPAAVAPAVEVPTPGALTPAPPTTDAAAPAAAPPSAPGPAAASAVPPADAGSDSSGTVPWPPAPLLQIGDLPTVQLTAWRGLQASEVAASAVHAGGLSAPSPTPWSVGAAPGVNLGRGAGAVSPAGTPLAGGSVLPHLVAVSRIASGASVPSGRSGTGGVSSGAPSGGTGAVSRLAGSPVLGTPPGGGPIPSGGLAGPSGGSARPAPDVRTASVVNPTVARLADPTAGSPTGPAAQTGSDSPGAWSLEGAQADSAWTQAPWAGAGSDEPIAQAPGLTSGGLREVHESLAGFVLPTSAEGSPAAPGSPSGGPPRLPTGTAPVTARGPAPLVARTLAGPPVGGRAAGPGRDVADGRVSAAVPGGPPAAFGSGAVAFGSASLQRLPGRPPEALSVARAAGSTLPTAGDVAVTLGLGTRDADGSVVFAPPADGHGGPPPGASVQRALEEPAAAPSGAEPPPLGVEASAAPSAGPAGGSGGGAEDLDTLAIRLYPRISRQLRLELTRERDRLGALTDFRH